MKYTTKGSQKQAVKKIVSEEMISSEQTLIFSEKEQRYELYDEEREERLLEMRLKIMRN